MSLTIPDILFANALAYGQSPETYQGDNVLSSLFYATYLHRFPHLPFISCHAVETVHYELEDEDGDIDSPDRTADDVYRLGAKILAIRYPELSGHHLSFSAYGAAVDALTTKLPQVLQLTPVDYSWVHPILPFGSSVRMGYVENWFLAAGLFPLELRCENSWDEFNIMEYLESVPWPRIGVTPFNSGVKRGLVFPLSSTTASLPGYTVFGEALWDQLSHNVYPAIVPIPTGHLDSFEYSDTDG